MREWLYMLRMELRVLLRGPIFTIACLLFVGYAFLIEKSVREFSSILHWGYYIRQFQYWFLFPVTILAIITAVYQARKDAVSGFSSLLNSCPHSTLKQTSARMAALQLPFVLLSLAPVAVWLLAPAASLSEERGYVALLLASGYVPLCFFIVTGFVIGSLIPGRSAYAAALGLWCLFSPIGLMILYPALSIPLRELLNAFVPFGDYFDYFTGFTRDPAFWLSRSAYAAVCAALLYGLIRHVQHRRREPYRFATVGSVVGLVATIVTTAIYFNLQNERLSAARAEAALVAIEQQPLADKAMDGRIQPAPGFAVPDYQLEMRLAEDSTIQFQARLNVAADRPDEHGELIDPTAISRLTFTLWERLELTSLRLDGQDHPYSREGSLLHIPVAAGDWTNSQLTLDLEYRGQTDLWRPLRPYRQAYEVLAPQYEANKHRLLLPGHLAWYPLPGHLVSRRLFQTKPSTAEPPPPYDAIDTLYTPGVTASFTVTVHYPDSLQLVSNLADTTAEKQDGVQTVRFAGEATGVTLMGGRLKTIAYESEAFTVRAVTHEGFSSTHMEQFLENYHRIARKLYTLLQVPDNQITLAVVDNMMTSDGLRQTESIVRLSKRLIATADFDAASAVAMLMYDNALGLNVSADSYSDQLPVAANNRTLWRALLKSYMLHWENRPFALDMTLTRNNQQLAGALKTIEAYMNANTDAEIGRLIRLLREAIVDDPLQFVNPETLIVRMGR